MGLFLTDCSCSQVENVFSAMDSEIKWKWDRGVMVRMRSGLYAPVFSEQQLAEVVKQGQ